MECVASRRTCVCVCFFFFWRGGGGNTGNCVHCLSGCKIIYPIGEIGTSLSRPDTECTMVLDVGDMFTVVGCVLMLCHCVGEIGNYVSMDTLSSLILLVVLQVPVCGSAS